MNHYLLTTTLEAVAKRAVIEQSQEVAPLEGSGADDQHVGGYRVGQSLHPTYVPYLTHRAHS